MSALLAAALPGLEIRSTAPGAGPWLESAGGAPRFRLVRAGGRHCLWHGERTADIAADLDSAAPLLDRIEQVSGWRFEPRELADGTPTAVILVDDGESAVEIALDPGEAPPPELAAAAAAAPRDPARPVARPLALTIPGIPVDQAAALEPGDLLLLPAVAAAVLDTAPVTLDLATGGLTASRLAASDGSETRFAVPLELRLDPALLSDRDMERLGDGKEVGLGRLPEGATAYLSAGGRPIGSGRLLRLGAALAFRMDAPETETETGDDR